MKKRGRPSGIRASKAQVSAARRNAYKAAILAVGRKRLGGTSGSSR